MKGESRTAPHAASSPISRSFYSTTPSAPPTRLVPLLLLSIMHYHHHLQHPTHLTPLALSLSSTSQSCTPPLPPPHPHPPRLVPLLLSPQPERDLEQHMLTTLNIVDAASGTHIEPRILNQASSTLSKTFAQGTLRWACARKCLRVGPHRGHVSREIFDQAEGRGIFVDPAPAEAH